MQVRLEDFVIVFEKTGEKWNVPECGLSNYST